MYPPTDVASIALAAAAAHGALVSGGAYFRRARRLDPMRGVRLLLGAAAAGLHLACAVARAASSPGDGGALRAGGEMWLSAALAILLPAAYALRDRGAGALSIAVLVAYAPAIGAQIASGGRWFALDVASTFFAASLVASMRDLRGSCAPEDALPAVAVAPSKSIPLGPLLLPPQPPVGGAGLPL